MEDTNLSFRLILLAFLALGCALALAKIQGALDWSWWLVLSPFYPLVGMIGMLAWVAYAIRKASE